MTVDACIPERYELYCYWDSTDTYTLIGKFKNIDALESCVEREGIPEQELYVKTFYNDEDGCPETAWSALEYYRGQLRAGPMI